MLEEVINLTNLNLAFHEMFLRKFWTITVK